MSKRHKAIRANLYSVHWENDKEHGYFHEVIRILALDAADAIVATRPVGVGNIHVKSVDLLAENITVLLTDAVLPRLSGPEPAKT